RGRPGSETDPCRTADQSQKVQHLRSRDGLDSESSGKRPEARRLSRGYHHSRDEESDGEFQSFEPVRNKPQRRKNRGQTPINSRAVRNFAVRNYELPLN